MRPNLTILGPYKAGEIPEPAEYTWLDFDGVPVDLRGHTASIRWRIGTGTPVERSMTVVDPEGGTVAYQWQEGDLAEAGVMRGEMIVENGQRRLMRSFAMKITAATPTEGV